MCDTCDDSRFEVIEKYKQKLLDATNIEDSPEEMAVIDNILFRFWQMGWLNGEVFGNSEQLDDTISRRGTVKAIRDAMLAWSSMPQWREDKIVDAVKALPSAQSEITYQTCSDALLKMWMDNVLTDGEYNRIMDRLNAWKGAQT